MRYALSVLAHEKPEVVIDQIQNIAHFLPEAQVVLHLHTSFDWGGPEVDFARFENVSVNPHSVPTFWGNLHHAHHANYHFACKSFEFSHFLMHSSSDLFVRKGVSDYIEQGTAGVSIVPPQATWSAPMFAEGDPVFQRIMKDAGASELWCSQVEGTFYEKKLFGEMVQIIERHFDYRQTLPYVHEEIYYPTIAKGLGVSLSDPYLLREDKENLPPFSVDLLDSINKGQVSDYHIRRWKLGRMVESRVWKGENIYAIRPIPRVVDHPMRAHVRTLMEAA